MIAAPPPSTWETPVYPDEPIQFTEDLSVVRFGRYLLYLDRRERPFRMNRVDHVDHFWATVSLLYTVGLIQRQADIVQAFKVSLACVRRAVKVYLLYDVVGFYAPGQARASVSKPPTIASIRRQHRASAKEFNQQRPPEPGRRKRPAALTLPLLIRARDMLAQGVEPAEVADRLGVQRRAITGSVLLRRTDREDSNSE